MAPAAVRETNASWLQSRVLSICLQVSLKVAFLLNDTYAKLFATGTYTLSSTAFFYTDTIIIGDAANPPTIKAAAGFNGDYLIVAGQADGSARPCGGFFGETHFSIMSKSKLQAYGEKIVVYIPC